MPAPIIRADYDRLNETAAHFGQQAAQLRESLQQLSRQVDTLQNGDWLGQGARAFYAEMGGQVLPTLNRLVRALEQAADTTRQINQTAQQAEAEAAAFFRLAGGANGAGNGAAAALGALGAGVGRADGGSDGLPANAAAFIGGKATPGVTGSKRLGVTGSPIAKQALQRALAELAKHNPKLAEAIKKDAGLRNQLEKAIHAGYAVITTGSRQGGLNVPDGWIAVSPETTVSQLKDMATGAVKNPEILRHLSPKAADQLRKDPVLLERAMNWAEGGFKRSLGMNNKAGESRTRTDAAGTTVLLDPADPVGSLRNELTSAERPGMDWPVDRRWPNGQALYVQEGVQDRLQDDAANIFHALRAQKVATGKMSNNIPHFPTTHQPEVYQTVVQTYLDGYASEATAIESMRDILKNDPATEKRRADYQAEYARRWAEHAAKVKAGAGQPAQTTP